MASDRRVMALAIDLLLCGMLVAVVGSTSLLIGSALVMGFLWLTQRWAAGKGTRWLRIAACLAPFATATFLEWTHKASWATRGIRGASSLWAAQSPQEAQAKAAEFMKDLDIQPGHPLSEEEFGELKAALAKEDGVPMAVREGVIQALQPKGPQSELEMLRNDNARLTAELSEMKKPKGMLRHAFISILDDLGLGIGWTGLYFGVLGPQPKGPPRKGFGDVGRSRRALAF